MHDDDNYHKDDKKDYGNGEHQFMRPRPAEKVGQGDAKAVKHVKQYAGNQQYLKNGEKGILDSVHSRGEAFGTTDS